MSTRLKMTAALCFAGLFVRANGARAEAADADSARTLFKEGRALASAGKYAEACPKFEESLKLDVGIGTKFNLADCLEHVARPARARVLFLEVAELAHASGQRDREDAARARADALESEIPQLIVDVKISSPKLEILRDGLPLEPSKWGAPQPIDPGKHDIIASAPGKKPWSTKVDVALKSSPMAVSIPELESAEAVPAVVPPKKDETPKTAEPSAPREEPREPRPRTEDNTVPLVLYTGVGAGALLTGVSLVLYKLSNDKAKGICPRGAGCTTDEIQHHTELVRDAQTTRNLSYLGLGIMGASAIAAGVVLLTQPRTKEGKDRGSVIAGPLVGRDGFGAGMAGSF